MKTKRAARWKPNVETKSQIEKKERYEYSKLQKIKR